MTNNAFFLTIKILAKNTSIFKS